MINKREIGREKEALAAQYLKSQGFFILEKNYHCRLGEIDLIAREKGVLCFVEVKYRRNENIGFPEEAVNRTKQKKITLAAEYYLMMEEKTPDLDCRFDVVSICGDQVVLYRNAFEAYGF